MSEWENKEKQRCLLLMLGAAMWLDMMSYSEGQTTRDIVVIGWLLVFHITFSAALTDILLPAQNMRRTSLNLTKKCCVLKVNSDLTFNSLTLQNVRGIIMSRSSRACHRYLSVCLWNYDSVHWQHSRKKLINFFQALVISNLDHCSTLNLSIPAISIKPLQMV